MRYTTGVAVNFLYDSLQPAVICIKWPLECDVLHIWPLHLPLTVRFDPYMKIACGRFYVALDPPFRMKYSSEALSGELPGEVELVSTWTEALPFRRRQVGATLQGRRFYSA